MKKLLVIAIACVLALSFALVGCGGSSGGEGNTPASHEHEWSEATCTEPQVCSICGQTQGEALGHDVQEWTVDKEATCSEKGSRSGVCTRCGETVSEDIPKAEHTPGDWEVSKDYSVSSSGTVTPGEEVIECSVCGEVIDSREYTVELTTAQKNAMRSATSYLDFMSFSYDGLVGQLEYEGYSHEDAVFAVDHCGADWNEQAALKAQEYLDFMPFSRDGLIDQLEYEGFTYDQAVYGADAVGL